MKTLALPKSKLQPPPTKTEVIDALTRIRVEQLNKESKDKYEERQRLEAEVEPLLIEYAIANRKSLVCEGCFGYSYGKEEKLSNVKVEIELKHDDLSKDLLTKIRRIHALPERVRECDFKNIRKEVSASVNGMMPHDMRVSALLEDKTSREALEKMLEAIDV